MSSMPTTPPSAADFHLDPRPVAHLPLVRAVIEQLQIPRVLDDLLPADPRNRVSDAECVTVMLLNILEGRVALYDMERWLARTDTELLLGTGAQADAFNDARLAACLDHIAEIGTESVLSGVVKAYLGREGSPSTYTVHQDTTSISVYGAYEGADYRAVPAYGFSKDHRPDLKQLVFGLCLHGSAGIPLVSTMFSGNTADPVANRFQIEALADLLPEEDDVTLVGDCKLVDAETIGQLLLQKFHFVSLLPNTYSLREELVEDARLSGDLMKELARTPGKAKRDSPRVYRGCSVERPFRIGVPSVGDNNVREVNLRFLVVESTQLEEQEEEALQRRLTKEQATFDASLAAAAKRTYACETDALNALEKVTAKLRYHDARVGIKPEVVTLKRARRGRPRTEEPAPTATVFRIVEHEPLAASEDAIAKLRFHSRHFVLVTDHLAAETWSDERILTEYRHQHVIEGQTGFRWLKNIATVAPVFLHTPQRIAALGVVLMLGLMVRNYIQFELRRRLVETGETVPDRLDKPTRKPTTETALIAFAAVFVTHVTWGENSLGRKLTPLPAAARTVMRMLGVDESVFLTPPRRKMRAAPAEISGM